MNTIEKINRPTILYGAGSGASAAAMYMKRLFRFIYAIISTYDRGGSTGRFRERGEIAWGDLRKVIVAFARRSRWNRDLIYFIEKRWEDIQNVYDKSKPASYNGLVGGNALLSAFFQRDRDPLLAVRVVEKLLRNDPNHLVFPISADLGNTHCYGREFDATHQGEVQELAETKNEMFIGGSLSADRAANPNAPIPRLHPEAEKIIDEVGKKKGVFIASGGSSLDSVRVPLTTVGMSDAVGRFAGNGGEFILIINPLNQEHQPDSERPDDYIREFLSHAGLKIELIRLAVVNMRGNIPKDILKLNYKKDGSIPVITEKAKLARRTLIGDFVEWDITGKVRQNWKAIEAIRDDLIRYR
jgi:hypothetical protein